MTRTPLRLVLVAMLVVGLTVVPSVGLAMVGSAAAAQEKTACTTTVMHDKFRTDADAMTAIANASGATSTVDNTRVHIEESSAFYRIEAENPNGYCVAFTVEIGADAIPPAELPGTITSTSGNHTATWDAVHDFNASETYTRIEFVLPAGTTTTFAPNEYRVVSLAWASNGLQKGQTAWENISRKWGIDLSWGDEKQTVEKHEYELTVEHDGDSRVVPLKHPQTKEPLKEWYATYSVDGNNWREVGTNTEDPVYQHVNNESVRFTFNDADAQVKFVANPTWRHKLDKQISGYTFGIDWFGGLFSNDE